MRTALPKEEVVQAVERRRPSRVPMLLHLWNNPANFGEREGDVRALQAEYPQDACFLSPHMPGYWEDPADKNYLPGYSWMGCAQPSDWPAHAGHDAKVAIRDWRQLDAILARWPDARRPEVYADAARRMPAEADGRYVIMDWWYCFFERLWSLRGMQNVMLDFYENPGPLHRLLDALAGFYETLIRRAGREFRVQAVLTSDDIGMQTGPMFSKRVFDEFFKPRYARLIRAAHESGMHFWLHACGNILPFLDDFVEMGLDVIHPIQKYAMDERAVAARFGGRISFWTGMDVQRILPRGTPEEVRREVRFMVDTFDRPEGGCIITAGNAITADVPLENLRAFYDESYAYGLAHRRRC